MIPVFPKFLNSYTFLGFCLPFLPKMELTRLLSDKRILLSCNHQLATVAHLCLAVWVLILMNMLLLSTEAVAWSEQSTAKKLPVQSVSPLTNGCSNVRFGKMSLQMSGSGKRGKMTARLVNYSPYTLRDVALGVNLQPRAHLDVLRMSSTFRNKKARIVTHDRVIYFLGLKLPPKKKGKVHVKVRKMKDDSMVTQYGRYPPISISHRTNAVPPQFMLGSRRQAAAGVDELHPRQ